MAVLWLLAVVLLLLVLVARAQREHRVEEGAR